MRRHLSNDRIYRIIGGMHCLKSEDGSFVCGSREMVRKRTLSAARGGSNG